MTEADVKSETVRVVPSAAGRRKTRLKSVSYPLIELRRFFQRSSLSHRRLERALCLLREEHAYLISIPLSDQPQADTGDGDWAARSEALLEKVDEALERSDTELGWSCLKAASRYNLYGMGQRSPLLLRSRANAVWREAEKKLSGWRQKTVIDLVCEDGKAEDDKKLVDELLVDNVVRATQIVDEHHDNVYQRLGILGKRLRNLTVVMGLVWLAWITIAPPASFTSTDQQDLLGTEPGSRDFWIAISLLGLMGALLSIFLSIIASSGEFRIPVGLADNWITVARLGLAALTAIMAIILLFSGIINLGEIGRLTWVVALAAGFSERLVVRALEQLA